MVGYFDELKSYMLFNLVKYEVNCKRDVLFDEKSPGVVIANSSFRLLINNLF
jgi:hypothetical protein